MWSLGSIVSYTQDLLGLWVQISAELSLTMVQLIKSYLELKAKSQFWCLQLENKAHIYKISVFTDIL